jgi:hypothetical protein
MHFCEKTAPQLRKCPSLYRFYVKRDVYLTANASIAADIFITARFQEPRNTLELAKTLSMKDARREAEIPPHIEHHLYEMANPDFMHLGAAGLIQ